MTTGRHYSSRKRSSSPPRRDASYDYRHDRSGTRSTRDNYRDNDQKRRQYDREDRPTSRAGPDHPPPSTEIKSPPGFPPEYSWRRGDWLCPSPGCEGYVTEAKYRTCIQCGRSQPHFVTLMALARNERYRTDICDIPNCPLRTCERAHAVVELRDYSESRLYKKSSNTSPPMIPPSLSDTEIDAFCARWKLEEPAIAVLHRLPGPLGDLVNRQFMVSEPEVTNITNALLKCLADIIRPRVVSVAHSGFQDLLKQLLRVYSGPVGLACSFQGHLAIALEKEVMQVRVKDFSNEDLGLLAFALSFGGLCVVHTSTDLDNIKSVFPKLYIDLFERIRVVDNPSEIIYVAADAFEAATDRATQAKIDAISNPAPLLPTPE